MTNTKNRPMDKIKDKLKEKGLLLPLIVGVVALILGIVLGSSTGKAEAVVKTHTVTKTVQVKVPVPTVPKQCLDALDEADHGFTLASDMTSSFSDAIKAIQAADISGMTSATDDIKSINSSLDALSPQYNANKMLCRGAAD